MGSNIVKNKAEDIVLDEEGVAQGLQHKVLHEGLGGVLEQQISIPFDTILSNSLTISSNFTPHLS